MLKPIQKGKLKVKPDLSSRLAFINFLITQSGKHGL